MRNDHQFLDEAFVAGQRRRLLAQRALQSTAIEAEEKEDLAIQAASGNQAAETEDQAQDLTISENNRVLVDHLARRSSAIDRALAKIDDGTYGFSDVSGKRIPLDRLRAVPEAVCTLAEETPLIPR
jgi:DnaK suppressor protein